MRELVVLMLLMMAFPDDVRADQAAVASQALPNSETAMPKQLPGLPQGAACVDACIGATTQCLAPPGVHVLCRQ
jgi:hypothetical protein